jgi:hypothetical protein
MSTAVNKIQEDSTMRILLTVHGVGPTDITFVNPADDPRKK